MARVHSTASEFKSRAWSRPGHAWKRIRVPSPWQLCAYFCRLVKSLVVACALHGYFTSAKDYAAVDAIFSKYCLDCHGSKDPDAKLVLEDFDSLMKGGQDGPVIVPANSGASLLVRMVEGTYGQGRQKPHHAAGQKTQEARTPRKSPPSKRGLTPARSGPAPGVTRSLRN